MRLCILSNSHAAALKGARDARAEAGQPITIFAAPNRGLAGLRHVPGTRRLEPRNPKVGEMIALATKGPAFVEADEYDAFLVHGLFLIPPRLDRRHSRAVQVAAVRDMLAGSEVPAIVGLLRAVTEAPILISPEPLLADRDIDPPPATIPAEPLPYAEICRLIESEAGLEGVDWLWQPEATIGDRLDTLTEYSTGSQRLSSEEVTHKVQDIRHMNTEYGARVLEAALTRLAGAVPA